jgi:hypothetical protein
MITTPFEMLVVYALAYAAGVLSTLLVCIYINLIIDDLQPA